MKRYECLQAIAPMMTDELFVTTAGGATGECNAVRPSDANVQVKTLGLCSSIGLGLAPSLPHRRVVVFDGDGALWMNLGTLATIGLHQPRNLIHICWDNHQYEASGGEPTATASERVDFAAVARGAGIESSRRVTTIEALKETRAYALGHEGSHFILASIEAGRTRAQRPSAHYDDWRTSPALSGISSRPRASPFWGDKHPHSREGCFVRLTKPQTTGHR